MRYPAIAYLGSAAMRRYPLLTTMILNTSDICLHLIKKKDGKLSKGCMVQYLIK